MPKLLKSLQNMQKMSWPMLLVIGVVFNHLPATHSQSYVWSFGDNQPSFFSLNDFRQFDLLDKFVNNRTHTDPPPNGLTATKVVPPPDSSSYTTATLNTKFESPEQVEEKEPRTESIDFERGNNSTKIIFIRKSLNENTNEFSKTAMDVITIVWYVATFMALAAFFMLMACSDRRCNDTLRNPPNAENANENPVAPPTPSPSYSEFAPPSYESVIKMYQETKDNIFVIPMTSSGLDNANKDSNQVITSPPVASAPPVTFYTVNELQKLGS